MKRRLTIEISDTAFRLATEMVTTGCSDTVEEAIERSIRIASYHDAEQIALEETWSPEFRAELKASITDSLAEIAAEGPGGAPEVARAQVAAAG